ncbi:hypothetical protein O6H91_02G107200 [Diphasiastrum complanatum]|uniref:Uncharacterized protein n=1 Tax=Diphasiastrum complanatum TaxID=34168 RepID=A0ACC2EJF4_DIPCM|nr:hypothetical protein O6H91_02G107200 [Diphasiastrum complanatum]
MGSYNKVHGVEEKSLNYGNPFMVGDGYTGLNQRFVSERYNSGSSESFHAADDYYSEDQSSAFEYARDYDDALSSTSSRNRFNDAGLPFQSPVHARTDHDDGEIQNMPSPYSYENPFEKIRFADEKPVFDASYCDSNDEDSEGISSDLFDIPRKLFYHSSEDPIPPYLKEMQSEEGFLLREWERKNEQNLHEKEAKERDRLAQTMTVADEYKVKFNEKLKSDLEASKKKNREKEKEFLRESENLHATAEKHYWKAVAALLPTKMPVHEIESCNCKDKHGIKHSAVVNRHPKPGKPTDLSRMHQILMKLKNNTPDHLKLSSCTLGRTAVPNPIKAQPSSSRGKSTAISPNEAIAIQIAYSCCYLNTPTMLPNSKEA